MEEHRHGAHTVFEIYLHLVWVTKYRELNREVCGEQDVHILKGHISKDHVHLLVSMPPRSTISRLVQRMKRKSAYKLLGSSGR